MINIYGKKLSLLKLNIKHREEIRAQTFGNKFKFFRYGNTCVLRILILFRFRRFFTTVKVSSLRFTIANTTGAFYDLEKKGTPKKNEINPLRVLYKSLVHVANRNKTQTIKTSNTDNIQD